MVIEYQLNAVNKYHISISGIDQITLENMEKELNAEYVPFYFHDVRTNEIVSFHAFLSSINDDYTVNYDSIESMGRVEPVKIYKSTTRSISLSFFIVSTSPNDFNDMYVKINKLTTLIYPQYTEGRSVSDSNGYNFIQPFSQLVGASPLIRIRLGNLFTTNYSKFNLARLFGATLKGTKLNNQELNFDGSEYENLKLENYYVKSFDKTWLLTPGITVDRVTGINTNNSAPQWIAGEEARYLPLKITKVENNMAYVIVNLPDNNFLSEQGIADLEQQTAIKLYLSKFNQTSNPTQNIVNSTYIVPTQCLKPTNNTLKKIFADKFKNSGDIVNLTDFLYDDKNAIVKSFKSAGGKGLAGFINTMNIDWYENTTWDTDRDKLAPKMCKVSITFSPIHDITPGLDSQGYNRAPIYNVGYYAHKI